MTQSDAEKLATAVRALTRIALGRKRSKTRPGALNPIYRPEIFAIAREACDELDLRYDCQQIEQIDPKP